MNYSARSIKGHVSYALFTHTSIPTIFNSALYRKFLHYFVILQSEVLRQPLNGEHTMCIADKPKKVNNLNQKIVQSIKE